MDNIQRSSAAVLDVAESKAIRTPQTNRECHMQATRAVRRYRA